MGTKTGMPAEARLMAQIGLKEPVDELLAILHPDGSKFTPEEQERVSDILGRLCSEVARAVLLAVGAEPVECDCDRCRQRRTPH